jgi:hypothetical protein
VFEPPCRGVTNYPQRSPRVRNASARTRSTDKINESRPLREQFDQLRLQSVTSVGGALPGRTRRLRPQRRRGRSAVLRLVILAQGRAACSTGRRPGGPELTIATCSRRRRTAGLGERPPGGPWHASLQADHRWAVSRLG